MKFAVISIFPDMFTPLDYGVVGRAKKQGLVDVSLYDPRDHSQCKHHTVDDRPYGGGPGMVMGIQPISDTINLARESIGQDTKVIYLSPQGKKFDYNAAKQFTAGKKLILLAGRYEGIDERIITSQVDEEWSIGDYVLTGGELAIMVMIDAITRLLPGVLGDEDSAQQDSFCEGLLDYPHFTRPEEYQGLKVPTVLLSGDHKAIAKWRLKQALLRTWERRPDLLEAMQLTPEQQRILAELTKGDA